MQTARRGVAQSVSQGAAFEDDARRLSQTMHEPLDAFRPAFTRWFSCCMSTVARAARVYTRRPQRFVWRRGPARVWIPEADGNRRIWRISCVTNGPPDLFQKHTETARFLFHLATGGGTVSFQKLRPSARSSFRSANADCFASSLNEGLWRVQGSGSTSVRQLAFYLVSGAGHTTA